MNKGVGIEIEFTGVKRSDVVSALENLFQSKAEALKSKTTDDGYTYHKVKDMNGDTWRVKRDRTIKPQSYIYKVDNYYKIEDYCGDNKFTVVDLDDYPNIEDKTEYMCELVSPVLTPDTLPTLFSVVDVIKSLGGIVNKSCGLHVHIDALSIKDIVTLMKKFILEQKDIFEAFSVEEERLKKFCKAYNPNISVPYCTDLDDFLYWLWENYRDMDKDANSPILKSKSLRYYALNFYALIQHGTIEYRLFNASLDKLEIAKIIDWVVHFTYQSEGYLDYLPVLSSILMCDCAKEV